MAGLTPEALGLLHESVGAGDPLVGVYLDLRTLHVVKIRGGRCDPPDLDPEKVEEDEARFAEIPVVTTTVEYLWMQDFVEPYDERRVTSCLDGKKGANARFLKRLGKQAPDVFPAWEAFRAERVRKLVADWLDALGVTPPDATG